MIRALFGGQDPEAVKALSEAEGKTIKSVTLHRPPAHEDGVLDVRFEDGTGLRMKDCARSCCESRYLHTDDDLAYYAGAMYLGAELRDGGSTEGEYGDTSESQFLLVNTSKGTFTVVAYNDHNGYYGGISFGVDILPEEQS